jgi:hypothetical protein
MRRPLTVPRAVGVAVLALVFAGCGDGGGSGSTQSPSRPSQTVRQAAPSTAKPVVAWPAPPDPLARTVAASGSCVGQYCNPEPIAFYVDGTPYTQQPGTIELTDHKEIAVVIGTPPPQIPKTADFSNA